MIKTRAAHTEELNKAFEEAKMKCKAAGNEATAFEILEVFVQKCTEGMITNVAGAIGMASMFGGFLENLPLNTSLSEMNRLWEKYSNEVDDLEIDDYKTLEKLLKDLTEIKFDLPMFSTVDSDFLATSNEFFHALYEMWVAREAVR